MVVTFGFLAAAFYFAYRPGVCATAIDGATCCPPPGEKPKLLQRLNRAMLWVVTAVAAAFLFFPNYVSFVVNDDDPAIMEAGESNLVLSIEGMTCEACAVTLKRKLISVPGVGAVDVDYDQKQALIGFSKGATMPDTSALLLAVEEAGYQGQLEESEAGDQSLGSSF